MPRRQDANINPNYFHPNFATFAFDALTRIAEDHPDPDLRGQLIDIKCGIEVSIIEFTESLQHDLQSDKDRLGSYAKEALMLTHNLLQTLNTSNTVMLSKLGDLLDQLYVSEHTNIETKDALYDIRNRLKDDRAIAEEAHLEIIKVIERACSDVNEQIYR